jgi:hypothetical protein
MDFCFNCGTKLDPDWAFCKSCGSGFDAPESEAAAPTVVTTPAAPKVELISRGWDVVDVETVTHPTDPLEDDLVDVPLPPGAIEISVDDVTVVETPEDPPAESADQTSSDDPAPVTDQWDHLRPHAYIPGTTTPATAPARVGQVSMLMVAVAGLVATALHFYLNTRLDAFGDGTISQRALSNARTVADASLWVMLGLVVVALSSLVWWMLKTDNRSSLQPGSAVSLVIAAAVSGATIVTVFSLLDNETVADAITANTLIALGLGLVMLSCLGTVRAIGRIELEDMQ